MNDPHIRNPIPYPSVSGYEPGDGNYGAHVLLLHESHSFQSFYSLYGHLSKGYCAAKDLAEMDSLCPSPLPLFRIR